MQAIREIVEIRNQTLKIILPKRFDNSRVEVIVLPYEQKVEKHNKKASSLRGKLCLTKQQYDDFHNEILKGREEWRESI